MTKQEEVVDLMMVNELRLKELYLIYAERFPDLKNFWKIIANDEEEHAQWLKHLYLLVEGGAVYFDEERFNTSALTTFYESVLAALEEAKSDKINLLSALSSAVNIEDALIERDFFKVFESDAAELKKTLKVLLDGSIIHLKKVKGKLQEERSKNESV